MRSRHQDALRDIVLDDSATEALEENGEDSYVFVRNGTPIVLASSGMGREAVDKSRGASASAPDPMSLVTPVGGVGDNMLTLDLASALSGAGADAMMDLPQLADMAGRIAAAGDLGGLDINIQAGGFAGVDLANLTGANMAADGTGAGTDALFNAVTTAAGTDGAAPSVMSGIEGQPSTDPAPAEASTGAAAVAAPDSMDDIFGTGAGGDGPEDAVMGIADSPSHPGDDDDEGAAALKAMMDSADKSGNAAAPPGGTAADSNTGAVTAPTGGVPDPNSTLDVDFSNLDNMDADAMAAVTAATADGSGGLEGLDLLGGGGGDGGAGAGDDHGAAPVAAMQGGERAMADGGGDHLDLDIGGDTAVGAGDAGTDPSAATAAALTGGAVQESSALGDADLPQGGDSLDDLLYMDMDMDMGAGAFDEDFNF